MPRRETAPSSWFGTGGGGEHTGGVRLPIGTSGFKHLVVFCGSVLQTVAVCGGGGGGSAVLLQRLSQCAGWYFRVYALVLGGVSDRLGGWRVGSAVY